jgi:hypothetical protein
MMVRVLFGVAIRLCSRLALMTFSSSLNVRDAQMEAFRKQ